jgi:hypothetical protein
MYVLQRVIKFDYILVFTYKYVKNMITYKLRTCTHELSDVNREFMRVIRMSYQAWRSDPTCSLSEMESHIKTFKWAHLDASLIKMAVNQAKNLRERPDVIFCRKLFEHLKWHKGDQDTNKLSYVRARNTGMLLRGSSGDPNGNRKAQLDIANNQVLIKPKRGEVIPLLLRLPRKWHKNLMRLQLACEQGNAYFNIQINDDHVCISFDEQVIAHTQSYDPIPGRILSIDSNPNYLGVVIADTSDIIHKEIIDLFDLNHKKVATNKKRHEKYQAIRHVMQLAAHYRCASIAAEQLHMPGKNHKKGRTFNRLVNNTWHKNLMHNSLKKWCVIYGIRFIPVLAAYSSFVGCIQNPGEFDSIAAAIELNKRARLALKHQKYDVLPKNFDPERIPTPWKEMGLAVLLADGLTSWRQLYERCARTKFSYRVGYKRGVHGDITSRSLNSIRSLVQVVHLRADQVVDLCHRV